MISFKGSQNEALVLSEDQGGDPIIDAYQKLNDKVDVVISKIKNRKLKSQNGGKTHK